MTHQPSLSLVPSEQLVLHEEHEPFRLEKTCLKLKKDQKLKHPVLVTPMKDGYMVLDGAHRTDSLRKLGCKWIPVQIVQSDECILRYWSHRIPDGDWYDRWIEEHQVVVASGEQPFTRLASVWRGKQKEHLYVSSADWLPLWRELVKSYNHLFSVERIPDDFLSSEDNEGMILFQYPSYSLPQIQQVVQTGGTIPAGVTRFLVTNRAYHLQVPLEMLVVDHPDQVTWKQIIEKWRNEQEAAVASI